MGTNVPKDRETLFQICFILDAGLGGTAKILGMAEESHASITAIPGELVSCLRAEDGQKL